MDHVEYVSANDTLEEEDLDTITSLDVETLSGGSSIYRSPITVLGKLPSRPSSVFGSHNRADQSQEGVTRRTEIETQVDRSSSGSPAAITAFVQLPSRPSSVFGSHNTSDQSQEGATCRRDMYIGERDLEPGACPQHGEVSFHSDPGIVEEGEEGQIVPWIRRNWKVMHWVFAAILIVGVVIWAGTYFGLRNTDGSENSSVNSSSSEDPPAFLNIDMSHFVFFHDLFHKLKAGGCSGTLVVWPNVQKIDTINGTLILGSDVDEWWSEEKLMSHFENHHNIVVSTGEMNSNEEIQVVGYEKVFSGGLINGDLQSHILRINALEDTLDWNAKHIEAISLTYKLKDTLAFVSTPNTTFLMKHKFALNFTLLAVDKLQDFIKFREEKDKENFQKRRLSVKNAEISNYLVDVSGRVRVMVNDEKKFETFNEEQKKLVNLQRSYTSKYPEKPDITERGPYKETTTEVYLAVKGWNRGPVEVLHLFSALPAYMKEKNVDITLSPQTVRIFQSKAPSGDKEERIELTYHTKNPDYEKMDITFALVKKSDI